MRMVTLLPALALVIGCGGKSDDSAGPAGSCDEYSTTPAPSLTPDQYPDGLAAGITALRNLEGLWRGSHCLPDYTGRPIDIKIENMPTIPDDLLVVDSAPDSSVQCGCAADPAYGWDNQLDIVAQVPEFVLFFDPDPLAPIDPAVDQQQFEVTGALYAGTSGLYYRGCQTKGVEPYLNSEFDDVAVNIRIETIATGTPLEIEQGQVTLGVSMIQQAQGVDPVQCDIIDFEKIQAK